MCSAPEIFESLETEAPFGSLGWSTCNAEIHITAYLSSVREGPLRSVSPSDGTSDPRQDGTHGSPSLLGNNVGPEEEETVKYWFEEQSDIYPGCFITFSVRRIGPPLSFSHHHHPP
jgi:hypothetical protein